MSLARAFTTRRAKGSQGSQDFGDAIKLPQRSNTLHKTAPQQPLRQKISAPMQLVHTTNMLSYNAPDLPHPDRNLTPGASRREGMRPEPRRSEDDSDAGTAAESTPPTSPEAEPFEHCAPAPNHLSSYFVAPGTTVIHPSAPEVPAIPKRSPSHVKKSSYDVVTRQPSISRMSKTSEQSISPKNSLTFSRSSSTSTRASSASHVSVPHTKQALPPMPVAVAVPMPPPQAQRPHASSNPFGNELAKVSELAAEFSAKSRLEVIKEDELYIMQRGLARMTPDDYLNDIHVLMASFFPEEKMAHMSRPLEPMWI
jgi:hypothetical protein